VKGSQRAQVSGTTAIESGPPCERSRTMTCQNFVKLHRPPCRFSAAVDVNGMVALTPPLPWWRHRQTLAYVDFELEFALLDGCVKCHDDRTPGLGG
jgi:hypothetical protein